MAEWHTSVGVGLNLGGRDKREKVASQGKKVLQVTMVESRKCSGVNVKKH